MLLGRKPAHLRLVRGLQVRARDGRQAGRCRDRPRSRAQHAPRARRVERPAAPLPQRVLGASPRRARRSRPSGVARPRRTKAPATPHVQPRHRPGSKAPRSEARPRASPRPAWPDDQALPFQRCRGRRSRRSRDQRETSAVADADGPFTHPGVRCNAEREVSIRLEWGKPSQLPPFPCTRRAHRGQPRSTHSRERTFAQALNGWGVAVLASSNDPALDRLREGDDLPTWVGEWSARGCQG